MTASIPNGFSSDELEEMLELAKATKNEWQPEEPEGQGPYGRQGLTRDQLESLAEELLDESLERCTDPMLHKLMTLTIVMRFASWHQKIADAHFERGETAAGGAWMRDAGKFQAVMDILTSVSLGPDDFACSFDIEE